MPIWPTSARRWLLSAVLVASFGLLLVLVNTGWTPLARLDVGSVRALHGFAVGHPEFVLLMKLISWAGSGPASSVLAVVFAVGLLCRGAAGPACVVVVAVGGSAPLNLLAKELVQRARPAWADPVAWAGGFSFPSGHSQASIVGYGVLLLFVLPAFATTLPRTARGVVTALVVVAVGAVGFSRVALGVHYPSDVVGGYLLGAAWLAAVRLPPGAVPHRPRPREPGPAATLSGSFVHRSGTWGAQ